MTHHSSQAQFRKELLCIEHLSVSYLKLHLLDAFIVILSKLLFARKSLNVKKKEAFCLAYCSEDGLDLNLKNLTNFILNTNINEPAVDALRLWLKRRKRE